MATDALTASSYEIFGGGTDQSHTVTGTEVLDRDMYYKDLTVPSSATLVTAGYRVFVRNRATITGTIRNNGANGSNGSNSSGGVGGSAAPAGTLGSGVDGTKGANSGFSSGSQAQTPTAAPASTGGGGGAGGSGASTSGGGTGAGTIKSDDSFEIATAQIV